MWGKISKKVILTILVILFILSSCTQKVEQELTLEDFMFMMKMGKL